MRSREDCGWSVFVLRSENELRILSCHGTVGKLWERRGTQGREGHSKERAVTKRGVVQLLERLLQARTLLAVTDRPVSSIATDFEQFLPRGWSSLPAA